MPIRFVNEENSRGLTRGGVLNTVRHELELTCDASEMAEEVVIDLAGLDIGDSIHISNVILPRVQPRRSPDRDSRSPRSSRPSGLKMEAEDAAAEAAAPDEVPVVW